MTTVYFAGQDNFGNRGCEALIRSSVATINAAHPGTTFAVPSRDLARDAQQWPSADLVGVHFVSAEPIPQTIRWWSRLRRVVPVMSRHVPRYKPTPQTRALIKRADALIMTGGDIISLDYGLESLFYWTQICETAMSCGVKSVLWAGSVGPFDKQPGVEREMRQFLSRFSLITVRETASQRYLSSLLGREIPLVADPAFALDSEEAPAECRAIFANDAEVLGFNVSPLIRKFRSGPADAAVLDGEVVMFLDQVLKTRTYRVLLIPHVDPLNGTTENSDSAYMRGLLQQLVTKGWGADRIQLLPPTLNAAQLKDVIGRCRYFMGARTHATVAALSKGVPTASIAYSVKAKGINQDLFGHLRYVLETPSLSCDTLGEHLVALENERTQIVGHLNTTIPLWRERANLSAQMLRAILAAPNVAA